VFTIRKNNFVYVILFISVFPFTTILLPLLLLSSSTRFPFSVPPHLLILLLFHVSFHLRSCFPSLLSPFLVILHSLHVPPSFYSSSLVLTASVG
jgi:hypothetical protein